VFTWLVCWCYQTPSWGWKREETPRIPNKRTIPQGLDQRRWKYCQTLHVEEARIQDSQEDEKDPKTPTSRLLQRGGAVPAAAEQSTRRQRNTPNEGNNQDRRVNVINGCRPDVVRVEIAGNNFPRCSTIDRPSVNLFLVHV